MNPCSVVPGLPKTRRTPSAMSCSIIARLPVILGMVGLQESFEGFHSPSSADADDLAPVGRVLVGVCDPHQERIVEEAPDELHADRRPAEDLPTGRASAGTTIFPFPRASMTWVASTGSTPGKATSRAHLPRPGVGLSR